MKKNILVGKTKIVLTDIRTGEVKTYEDKNTFQNTVVADYMRPLGAYNNSPYANSTWAGQKMWRNLAGGLLLFRDAIDLTGGPVKYMPAGNEMVGNGAYGVVNNSTPTELGSYNSTESQTTGPDSVSMVYDFTSSQGNGTIGCICLTTETGGYIGYGNRSGGAAESKIALNQKQSSNTLYGFVYNNERFGFSHSPSTGGVTVTRTPTEITNGSIFDGMSKTESYTYEPISGMSNPGIWSYCGGGIFRTPMTGAASWSSVENLADGSTFYYIEYNSTSKTLTKKSVTNSTGVSLGLSSGYGRSIVGFDCENHAIFYTVNNQSWFAPVYVMDLTTGTLALTITADIGVIGFGNGSNDSRFRPVKQIAPGMLMVSGVSSESTCYVCDFVSGTTYPANLSYDPGCVYNPDIDAIQPGGYGWGAGSGITMSGAFKNPLMLTTVNNLDSPVTKTANQTMKVTYTLTKVVV